MRQQAARLRLELATAEGPIAGRLWVDGTEQTFQGWLELASALERARPVSAPAPDPVAPNPRVCP